MEFLKKLFAQSKTHLAGLSVSQRAAIGLCVVVMLGALAWLLQWSARPETVALLNQDLSPEELGRIQTRLEDAGARYEVRNNRIYVSPDQRAMWLARLGEQQALPSDLSVSFDTLIRDQSPFLNMDEQAWRRSVALGNELAHVLRQFSGVADARVFIDKTEKRGIGRAPTVPTASVYVKMKPGSELDKNKVFALASFVSRSVGGLTVKNVGVTDATTGRSYTVPDPSDPAAFDDLDDRRRKEEYFTQRLLRVFAHIPGLLVGVHAELDAEAKTVESTKYGKPVKTSEETETTTQDRGSAGASPGVVANTARTVAAGGNAEKLEKTRGSEQYIGGVDKTVETSDRMRNGLRSLRASINVPRSYFVAIYKQANGGKEPKDADLEPLIREQLARIRKQASALIPAGPSSGPPAAADDSHIQVDWFYDAPLPGMAVVEAGTGNEVMGWVKAYAGQAGLGALAIVSLLAMMMVVRKASAAPILPGEEPPPEPLPLSRHARKARAAEPGIDPEVFVAGSPVGEAQVTEGLLVGREVDEDAVRAQQVVEQVSQLIEDDPDTAAALVKRWVESSK
ncbi:MAG TPA: flagellar M-ring protein FliF C-terminal domain-containing protein [Phycisphaerae bacterium]|nr:flagellar M-ring protein FliF C-terminal domain-containing protein [Phycisphaerae bacterium]